MIDITVLTLIGSDTPSLSDSSHVKRLVSKVMCGDLQLTLTHRISSENTSRELVRLLKSIGTSFDNSGGVNTLSGDVCTTLST